MNNISRQIQIILLAILFIIVVMAIIAIKKLGFDPLYYVCAIGVYTTITIAILRGVKWGLITSIIIVIIHAVIYINYKMRTSVSFDLTVSQALVLLIYPAVGGAFGRIGDGLLFHIKLQKKYPNELINMSLGRHFPMLSLKKFDLIIEAEIGRSRRMQNNFSIARVMVDDIEEIYRVFGRKGIYDVSERVQYYLRAIMKGRDKITAINDITYEIMFSGLNHEETTLRLKHLQKQLENAYMMYKNKDIRFIIKIVANIATFPEDGEEIYVLRRKVEGKHKRIGDILIEDGIISKDDLRKALHKQKEN